MRVGAYERDVMRQMVRAEEPRVLDLETCREQVNAIRMGQYQADAQNYLVASLQGDAIAAWVRRDSDADQMLQIVHQLREELSGGLRI